MCPAWHRPPVKVNPTAVAPAGPVFGPTQSLWKTIACLPKKQALDAPVHRHKHGALRRAFQTISQTKNFIMHVLHAFNTHC